jgi:hypothetical protein
MREGKISVKSFRAKCEVFLHRIHTDVELLEERLQTKIFSACFIKVSNFVQRKIAPHCSFPIKINKNHA